MRLVSTALPILLMATDISMVSCGRGYRLDPDHISAEGNWSCSGGSSAHLGFNAEGQFSGQLSLLWKRGIGGKPAGPLAIHNQTLVFPDTKKKIRFYDIATGRYLGRIKAKGNPQTGVALVDEMAIFAVSPRRSLLRAYNLLDSRLLWQRRVKDANSGPIIQDNRLYVSSGEGMLLAFELADGELAWQVEFENRLTASVSYRNGKLYQPGDPGVVYGLAVEDGRELFRAELDGPIVSAVAAADKIYAADMLGHVYALDPEDGARIWQTKLNGPIWTSPVVADHRIFVGHSGGEVVALNAADGKTIWSFDVGAVIRASVLVTGDLVVAGTMSGGLFVLRTDDGSLVDSTTLKGAIKFPPVTDGRRLLVATQAGKTVCFGEDNEQTGLTYQGVDP